MSGRLLAKRQAKEDADAAEAQRYADEVAANLAAAAAAQAYAQAQAQAQAQALAAGGTLPTVLLGDGSVPSNDEIYKFPATEMQHDFGDIGYKQSDINPIITSAAGQYFITSLLGTTVPASQAAQFARQNYHANTDAAMIQEVFGRTLQDAFRQDPPGVDHAITLTHLNQEGNNTYTKRQSGWRWRKSLTTNSGQTLLTELGILSGSVLVFDVDPGFMKRVKTPDVVTNSAIYVYNNPVILADPAPKPNPLRDSRNHFKVRTNPNEVQCIGITQTQQVDIGGTNTLQTAPDRQHLLFINSSIRNQNVGGQITQIWEHPNSANNGVEREVISAHSANSINTIKSSLEQGNRLSFNNCYKLIKKRSGDWLQAWFIVMMLRAIIGNFLVNFAQFIVKPLQTNLPTTTPNPDPDNIYLVTHDQQLICYSLYALAINRILFRLHIDGTDYFISMRR